MKETSPVKWLKAPEKQDYPAATSFLSLLYDGQAAKEMVARLKAAPVTLFKAKDIFRASALPLLDASNYHVRQDRRRIKARKRVSPILLVRDQKSRRVLIADGYHRMCAVYSFNEDASVPCQIVDANSEGA